MRSGFTQRAVELPGVISDPGRMFSFQAIEGLGAARVTETQQRLAAIRNFVAESPERTSFVRNMPIRFRSWQTAAAPAELVSFNCSSNCHPEKADTYMA
jgi:hypothetical protein